MVLSSRNTPMPWRASVMLSSQFPLELEPLIIFGTYTLRSMVANRPEFGQFPYRYLMISAAFGHEDADHAVCSGALLLVWSWMVADQASISWIDFCAYAVFPVRYQSSASVYAAMASSRSSVQP